MYFISLARRKSLPSIHCFPSPLLIFLGFTSSSSFGVESSSHGTVRKAFRSAAAFCLPLLRSDRHVFRAYWKNAFLKQYEKFSTLLRNELCSNNLSDFSLRKGLG